MLDESPIKNFIPHSFRCRQMSQLSLHRGSDVAMHPDASLLEVK